MGHPIVHIEFSANDHKEAAEFYKNVFDWQVMEFPDMNYTTFQPGEDQLGGGFNPISDTNPAGRVLVYINADDLEGTLSKIEENGGTVEIRNFEIPTVGWMATFRDPTGNLVALLKPLPRET